MKTKLFLLVLMLQSALLFGEVDKASSLFYQNETTIKTAFQEILNESGRVYELNKVIESQGRVYYTYIDTATVGSDELRTVVFGCLKIMIGENKDLEIEGTPVYTITIAEGRFMDFAPWWIKNIRPNETLEGLAAKGRDSKSVITEKTKETLQFLKQNHGKWILRGW